MGANTSPAELEHDVAPAPTDNLGWLLSVTAHALATEMTAALQSLHVSPRAHCVLSTAMKGDYTQTELAQAVGVDKTTMVTTIDELEAAGFAERKPSKTDRRARVIAVTKAGQKQVAEGEKIVEQTQEEVLATLPAREREVLIDALNRLVAGRLATPVACDRPVRRRAPRAA